MASNPEQKPQKYVSIPVEISAIRFNGKNFGAVQLMTGEKFFRKRNVRDMSVAKFPAEVYDHLHKTWVKVEAGNYIIKGTLDEFYPCAASVFEAKYERV